MVLGIPLDNLLVQYGAAMMVAIGLIGFGYLKYQAIEAEKAMDDGLTAESRVVDIEPPRTKSDRFALLKAARQARKKQRLSNKGFVQWYLIDESFPRPKFVKPKPKEGGGIPELEHDDVTYLFPRDGRIPSQEEGIWTYVHRQGESEPINLRDPNQLAIPADVLSEYLTLRVTSSPPGLLGLPSLGNLDSMDLLRYLVIGMIVLFIALEMTGGGLT